MIQFLKKEFSDSYIYSILDETVALWFKKKFKRFSKPQRFAVAEIHRKENVLISSPTGTGKTLSAFLAIISELVSLAKKNKLEDKVYAIYISPLRALDNDIKKNLMFVIEGIKKEKSLTEEQKEAIKNIRIGIRTSDTTSYEKSKMVKKPPHILITTPESLAISLNSPKFSQKLLPEYIVIDEIHALADNKRGTHLTLSLERLSWQKIEKENKDFVRIGLSATVNPLEEVAKFLVGDRDCKIIDANIFKKKEIIVESPVKDLVNSSAEEINKKMYEKIFKYIKNSKSTLIFTNTRSATERVVYNLKTKLGMESYAHHSSLSREHRLEVEEGLKKGEMNVVVSSTSLELGIDIGSIDQVILLSSPKSIARALQRIGRSGHKIDEAAKGIMFGLDRDDLIEVASIKINADKGKIDKVKIIKNAQDVLAQHIVGLALTKKWKEEEALKLIRRAYPYQTFSKTRFRKLLRYLAGEYVELEEKRIYGKIWYENGEFGKRGKGTRMIYYQNIGTIPDETGVRVFNEKNKLIGVVEEEFAERLTLGDKFVLGGAIYEFLGSRAGKLKVKKTDGNPTIPAWFSEMLPLSYELAQFIERFREEVANKTIEEINKKYKIGEVAEAIKRYIDIQKRFIVPGKIFVIEEYKDQDNWNYIFHSMAGRRANDALARVISYRIAKQIKKNLAISIVDNGFLITSKKRLNRENILKTIYEENFKEDLIDSLKNSEIIKRRFRHVATRSFLILKAYKGKWMSVARQQFNADYLLKFLENNYKDFPILEETYREVIEDYMHIDEAIDYLKKIRNRKIKIYNVKTISPFAFNIAITTNKDVILMENKHEFIKYLQKRFDEVYGNKKE